MYSSSLYSFTAQYVGLVNGDNFSIITTPPAFSLGSPVTGPGQYVIYASGAVAQHQITYVPGTLYVSEAASQVAISSSVPSSIVYGQDVLLTATVTGDTGVANPTGYVAFYDYGTPLGTATISGASASLDVSDWSPGSHGLTAVYEGDSNYVESLSADQVLTVAGYQRREPVGGTLRRRVGRDRDGRCGGTGIGNADRHRGIPGRHHGDRYGRP